PTKDPEFTPSSKDKWSKSEALDTANAISVGSSGDNHGFGMKDFKIWDSASKSALVQVSLVKDKDASGYVLTKHIPASFFAGAVAPAFTDTTITVYPDPDPEVTTVDGYVGRNTVDE